MATTSAKTSYVCQQCGHRTFKWMGRCPSCGEWETLEESLERRGRTEPQTPSVTAVAYPELEEGQVERRLTRNPEFDRVLGGGLVPGSVVLLGGEPGVGKSTLLLQVADQLASQGSRVLYVAGEESARQVKLRGDRLKLSGEGLYLLAGTELENVLGSATQLQPDVVVVDSIQTLYTEELESVPGSLAQVRECSGRLLRLAKQSSTAVILIGHITKDGLLAGPKTLEHIVDVVLYFEGEQHQNHRIVRAVKNRFGPANELGVFEMTGGGLTAVENPSRLFLSRRTSEVSGSAVMCTMEGSRPVLAEVQALVSRSSYGTARRMSSGLDPNRVSLLLAMLEKRLGLQLAGNDIFVNVAGGLTPCEPAADLAIVTAILSSFRERPLAPSTVCFGELGLAGEVRAVSFASARVKEAASLGFRRVILPEGNLPLPESIKEIELKPVSSISEYLLALDRTTPQKLQ